MRWTQPHNLKRPLKGQDGKLDHPNRGSEEGPGEMSEAKFTAPKASGIVHRRSQSHRPAPSHDERLRAILEPGRFPPSAEFWLAQPMDRAPTRSCPSARAGGEWKV